MSGKKELTSYSENSGYINEKKEAPRSFSQNVISNREQ